MSPWANRASHTGHPRRIASAWCDAPVHYVALLPLCQRPVRRTDPFVPLVGNSKMAFGQLCSGRRAQPLPLRLTWHDRPKFTCSLGMVQRYQKRISGPLMDRIDIYLEVKRVPYQKLEAAGTGETSKVIRDRIAAARRIQAERFAPLNRHHVLVNGDMGPAEVQRFCELDETGKNLMRAAVQQMNLSAWAYHCVLKLARTTADLAGEKNILPPHLAEALQHRPREIV